MSTESSGGRTRTCDPTVNSRLLYQLSYAGITPPKEEKKKLPMAVWSVNGMGRAWESVTFHQSQDGRCDIVGR